MQGNKRRLAVAVGDPDEQGFKRLKSPQDTASTSQGSDSKCTVLHTTSLQSSLKKRKKKKKPIEDPPELNKVLPSLADIKTITKPLKYADLPVDILLLTVTNCEFLACYSELENPYRCWFDNLGYVYFFDVGESQEELKVALLRCYRNGIGPGGALVSVKNAASMLRPKAVISVGTCSGLNPAKSKLGDVVVSAKLATYASKVVTNNQGQSTSMRSYVSKRFLRFIKNCTHGWQPPLKSPEAHRVQVHTDAEFLSGPEQVRAEWRRDQLAETNPQAMAIENGGEGLVTTAFDGQIEWLIVKGIADYADGSQLASASWSSCASVMAASLVAHILSEPYVFHSWPRYIPVPSEILARGSRATEAYNTALLEGKGYARRVPVMIIGQERTGKTSLKRSLKGELFNPNEGRTKGIETDPSYFKVSTDVWRTGKNSKDTESEPTFSFGHQIAQLIVESLMEKETKNPNAGDYSRSPSNSGIESSKVMESFMTDQSPQDLKPDEKVKADSAKEPRTKVMEPSLKNSQDHPRVPKLPEDVATLVQRLLEMNNDEDDIYSIIWDFGGQSVYYDTHPIFLTKKAIYILTCDLSHDPYQKSNAPTKKGMSGKKEDTCCSKTNLDCLDFWMSSVYSLVCPNTIRQGKLSPEMLPPVFLMCTHADEPYRTDKIPGDLASEIYGSLKEKVYGKLLKGLFVIDNTKSGSGDECRGVIKLREKVLSFAKELPQMKEAIPLKWLKYEEELHLWSERREWIPIEEARQIAKKECGIDDDVQFRTLLNFLHDQRVFIHFSESPELENMVILRPQWLIDVFKEVITVKSWQDVDENFEQLWCNLEKNGILDEKLLDHAWRHLLDKQEPTYKSSLIAIMERFNLLCPWPTDGTTKQYLVPSMLMSPPTEDVLKHLDCVRIPSLFVVFNSGRVPPGLFSRLLLLFHRFCQEEWKSEINPELFNNLAMFHIIPDRAISIVIMLYSSSIEIVFHDGRDSRDLNTSRAIYSQLKCLLEDIRKESFWLKDMKYEMCICCPVCSQKDSRCRAHDVRGCECLHLLTELELRDRPYCKKPGIRGDPTININTFEHWFALSEAQGSSTPLSQHQDVTKRDNNGEHRITPKEETASERSASDPPEVIINQLKKRDLPKRATHLAVRRLPVDVLLLTVEDCEFLSCLSYLNPGFCRKFHRDLGYVYLGDMGKDERKLNVAVMNCYRGSASAGGSVVVVLNAVKVLRPKAVFSVGSCRSLDCNKVKLGDVVVLEKLITYGPCKITEGGIEERGVKVPLKSGLLKVMLRAGDGWQSPLKDLNAREVEIKPGAFLSGPEEVIDSKRCEALLERFPEVVAIEREGEGLYAAAHDLDIEWTVIKGISGYADGRNESNSWRSFASLMAASLMAHILSDAIPFQDMRHYRNETEERGERRTSCKTCKKVSNSGGRRKKQRKGK